LTDPAIIGKGRIGYTRIGVLKPYFDEVVRQFESIPTTADPAIIGEGRIGHTRIGVLHNLFDPLKDKFENLPAPNKITVGGSAKLVVGGKPIRVGVLTDHFEELLKAVENIS